MGGALPFISAIAPIIGSFMSKPSPPSPPAQVAPPPPPAAPAAENTTDPKGALDAEAAKARALKRRRAQQSTGLTLLGSDTGSIQNQTLTGE